MSDKLIIKNGYVLDTDWTFQPKPVYCIGSRIVSEKQYFQTYGTETIIDAKGNLIIPGLIDIHFHGCLGHDCCDGTLEAFQQIASYELQHGITAITPATMTIPSSQLESICCTAKDYSFDDGADLCGLYMEGPFINIDKKGAQNGECVIPADTEFFEHLQNISNQKIKTVVIAPETEGALKFIQQNKGKVNISIAHTIADYATTQKAFQFGATQLTHLYNAMPGISHREPGPIIAAFDTSNVMVELICDGIHIHPAVVRATFQMFGEDRIIFISDSMRATGMSDGIYDLGGQKVKVKGSTASLMDGTLAGSVTNLMDCLKKAVKEMGIPLESAIKCATLNPARAIGIHDDYGTINAGYIANILIINKNMDLVDIIHHGKVYMRTTDHNIDYMA